MWKSWWLIIVKLCLVAGHFTLFFFEVWSIFSVKNQWQLSYRHWVKNWTLFFVFFPVTLYLLSPNAPALVWLYVSTNDFCWIALESFQNVNFPCLLSNLYLLFCPSSHRGVGWPWTHSASLSSPSRWPASSPSSGSSTKSAPGCPCASVPASLASVTNRRWNGTQGDPIWT